MEIPADNEGDHDGGDGDGPSEHPPIPGGLMDVVMLGEGITA